MKRLLILLCLTGLLSRLAVAAPAVAAPPVAAPRPTHPPRAVRAPVRAPVRRAILVNKWDNTLRYYETGRPMKIFRVATGLYKCTPQGRFRIIQKSFISRTGRGQFGTRWIGLNTLGKRGWYRIGIHGTNEPWTIGKHASKACVRMHNADINWLFDRVPYNTPVRIVNVPVAAPKPPARLAARQAAPVATPVATPWLAWLRRAAAQPSFSAFEPLGSLRERLDTSFHRSAALQRAQSAWWPTPLPPGATACPQVKNDRNLNPYLMNYGNRNTNRAISH